jgi:hypothetical protein
MTENVTCTFTLAPCLPCAIARATSKHTGWLHVGGITVLDRQHLGGVDVNTTKDLSLITYPVLARDFRCGWFVVTANTLQDVSSRVSLDVV